MNPDPLYTVTYTHPLTGKPVETIPMSHAEAQAALRAFKIEARP